ncbi:MAG: hypothetical protein UX89_C0022G0017 [Parcubacteria group bacterium GW2011_GWA2_47_16]|nr:MAG: hypothetical protein UX89_C0022G0017 [Parcubacteria group bacterium GW2011_GWA2_47_16]
MKHTILYDKAEYHFDADDWPKDVPAHQAYVHTGMFLSWIIDKDLFNKEFFDDFQEQKAVEACKNRVITGAQIYEEVLDGVLTNDALNAEGNDFAKYYFDTNNWPYLKDYMEVLCKGLPSEYHVKDTWENYDKLKQRIDENYSKWKQNKGKSFLSRLFS